MVSRTRAAATALGSALIGAAHATPMNVLFPVTEIILHDDPGNATRVQTLGTSFGRAAPRQADYVINGRSWASGKLSNRVPPALVDLDLAAAGLDDGALENEIAVMFGRGFGQLKAGPDVFLLDSEGRAIAITVSPVFRMEGDAMVEGEAVRISSAESFGVVETGGLEVAGVGIDLDAWGVQGGAPEGALLVGMVLRPADEGAAMTPMKIMLGDTLDPGEFMDRRPTGGTSGLNGIAYRGGARDQSGGASNEPPEADVVPSPSGATALLMSAALAALRRRRAV